MEILKVGIIINLIKNLLRVFASILIVLVVSACGSTNSSMPSTRVTNTPQESVESSILSGSQERIIKVPVSETESFIESSLLQKAGAITKVTCPARMEGQIGDFFECLVENLTIPSDSHFADVQIMNELGEISYVVRRD
jgi:hypothetical protein